MARIQPEPDAVAAAASSPAAVLEMPPSAAADPKPSPKTKAEKSDEKMPKPPGNKISAAQFYKFVNSLHPDHWSHLLMYVYRCWPVLGDPANIDKPSGPIDEEYMLREHGSGDYKIRLNDQNLPGNKRTICYTEIKLRDPERPPNIPDLSRLAMKDPANREYVAQLIRSGKLTPDGSLPAAPAAVDPALSGTVRDTISQLFQMVKDRNKEKNGTDSDALERGMQMLQKAHERSMELVSKNNDPTGFIQLVATLKELMPPPAPQPPVSPVAMIKEIAGMMRDMMPQAQAAQQQANPMSQFREFLEVFNAMRETSGADARPMGRTSWADVALSFVPTVPQVVGQIATAAALFSRGATAGMQQAAGARVTNGPHMAETEPPQLAPPANSAMDPNALSHPELAADPAVNQLARFLPMIGNALITYLNAGRSGADFADWVSDGYGQAAYGQISQLSAAQIRTALEMTPQLAPLIRAMKPAVVDEFIREFLNPETADEDAAAEPEKSKVQ